MRRLPGGARVSSAAPARRRLGRCPGLGVARAWAAVSTSAWRLLRGPCLGVAPGAPGPPAPRRRRGVPGPPAPRWRPGVPRPRLRRWRPGCRPRVRVGIVGRVATRARPRRRHRSAASGCPLSARGRRPCGAGRGTGRRWAVGHSRSPGRFHRRLHAGRVGHRQHAGQAEEPGGTGGHGAGGRRHKPASNDARERDAPRPHPPRGAHPGTILPARTRSRGGLWTSERRAAEPVDNAARLAHARTGTRDAPASATPHPVPIRRRRPTRAPAPTSRPVRARTPPAPGSVEPTPPCRKVHIAGRARAPQARKSSPRAGKSASPDRKEPPDREGPAGREVCPPCRKEPAGPGSAPRPGRGRGPGRAPPGRGGRSTGSTRNTRPGTGERPARGAGGPGRTRRGPGADPRAVQSAQSS